MHDPAYRPPIPTPDGNTPPLVPLMNVNRGDWQTAPPIVKSWVYPLSWLALVVLPLMMISALYMEVSQTERNIVFLIYAAFFLVVLWINRGIKKGARSVWAVQMILSVVGLLGFPIGTLIHGWILSQWFKPDVKAWFGRV